MATSERNPGLSEEVVRLAVPPVRAMVPSGRLKPRSLNVTVPVGMFEACIPATVAVRVTEPPATTGVPELLTVVAVAPTFWPPTRVPLPSA